MQQITNMNTYLIVVAAEVVPIRREDYYYATSDSNENDLVGFDKLDETDDNVHKASSTAPKHTRKKKFGTKLLRDRHNNLVYII